MFLPRLKGFLLRLMCPLFFRKIGPRLLCFGRVRFPRPYRNITLGRSLMLGDSVFFDCERSAKISVGASVSLNTGCHVVSCSSIIIGDNVAIGEYVSIRDQEHRFGLSTGVRGRGFVTDPILIGNNVWVGRGVYIGPGVVIGDGCVIGANSVVLRGIYPPGMLIVGAPAKVKKKITSA